MQRIIIVDERNIIIGERKGKELGEGQYFSQQGMLGQMMIEDGSFVDVPVESIEYIPSIEEQILYENKYQSMLLEMSAFN